MRLHEERLENKTLNLMKNFTLVLFSLLFSSVAFGQLIITVSFCEESPSAVRLTGPWWGWNPDGGPVAADNGDGTWTFTFDPVPEDNMEYKIIADGVWEDLTDEPCILNQGGYFNRFWYTTDSLVNDITFGQCAACTTTNLSSASKIENKFELFPNPASETLNIITSGDFQRLNIVNIYGSVVKDVRLSSTNSVINLEDLSSGIYFVNAFSGENKITQQITIK
ncbi:MAG: hypothetical protein CMP61_10525 [Flavobacteriales bacterium]|nr:hypothetical protein [Flavobacteriales bacterium]|tara:strand:+ start:13534 stop:14202 length:669 start_codon:yes stop_codon:yes gene_type:complete